MKHFLQKTEVAADRSVDASFFSVFAKGNIPIEDVGSDQTGLSYDEKSGRIFSVHCAKSPLGCSYIVAHERHCIAQF